MYISETNLSTRIINALLRAGINTVEKVCSVIDNNRICEVRGLDGDDINKIMSELYCRNCKRSIYGEYMDCDINVENGGKYARGNGKCGCKVSFVPE